MPIVNAATPCVLPMSSHPVQSSASPSRLIGLGVLLALLFFVAGGNANTPPAQSVSTQKPPEARGAAPDDRDARYRDLALGTWQDEYKGKRTMRLREDGTGSMVVELSGLSASLFASRLEFDMVWSIQDGRMQKRTVGGRPEGKVKAILAMMGDRVDEPILELSSQRLLLLDADGTTRYDWRRMEEE